MSLSQTVSQNIRNWRRVKDIKQEELAELINLDKTTLSKIENGLSEVNLSLLQKIADALEISPEFLIFYNPKSLISNANGTHHNYDNNGVCYGTQHQHLLDDEALNIIKSLQEQLILKDKQIEFLQTFSNKQ